MENFRVDRDVTRPCDVDVGGATFIAKTNGNLARNASTPIEGDRLQRSDESHTGIERKSLRRDARTAAKIHRDAVRRCGQHSHGC